MNNISIKARLLLVFGISIFAAITIFALSIFTSMRLSDLGVHEAQQIMLRGEKDKIKVATDSLARSLGNALGAIPQETEKVAFLKKAIKDVFFESDRSGYYYIYTGTVNVVHPVNPALQGKDLGGLQGQDGVYSVRELAKAAQAGGGFVSFRWDKPGKGNMPKLGYATNIPGTPYWIGTGVYIDNIDADSAKIAQLLQGHSNKMILVETGIFLLVFLVILLPLSLGISKNIAKSIQETTQAARDIAAGDLDVHLSVSGRNEISDMRQSLNAMAADLKTTNASLLREKEAALKEKEEATKAMREAEQAKAVSQRQSQDLLQAATELESVIEVLTSASQQLSAQIEQSSRGAEEQSSRIERTVTSMEEMNATVLEVAKNASGAAQNADDTRAKAEEGAAIVKQAVDGIEEIFRQSHTIKSDMGTLGTQAEGIGRIIGVISDIADQTNLLALNAAIEAARAGEAGRGFAVVADEVRKLAEKTMTATKEVGEAVRGIQDGTRQNIESVEHSVKTIEASTDLAVQSGQMLEAIVRMVDATTDEVRSIATAAEQQSAASEEISRNITDINELSSENATAMHQSAEAVVELSRQAHRLQALIEKMQCASGCTA